MASVGLIGLGAMGTALGEALLRQGHNLFVWNRSAGKAASLIASGAQLAETPMQVVSSTDLTIICLVDCAAVTHVLDGVVGLDGRTVVNLTNGTPEQARGIADTVALAGGRYLDGGIMAIPPIIGTPHALVLYSGDEAAYRSHRNTLEALGTAEFLGADAGLASLLDLSLLAGMYGLFSGVIQATVMAKAGNVPARQFSKLLTAWLQAMLLSVDDISARLDDHRFGQATSPLAMQLVAMENILSTSRQMGIDPGLIEPMARRIRQRVQRGGGADDISAIGDEISSSGSAVAAQ
ncbi:MAG: NAD(P)-dependent oxidoreductase [Mesorhizobium sp.]|nr:MAG: NAD(P)-dependent oxidoreductase [Mesorhizobium sp.]